MEKKNIKYYVGLVLSIIIIIAALIPTTSTNINATSATTYTMTRNADGQYIRCQDGYLPQTTYDRIGLNSPQDMVIDEVYEGNKLVEYGYILNQGDLNNGPFILQFRLDDVVNTVKKIDLVGTLKYINTPTGLWIQTTTVNGVTRKEMYIADGSASYKEVIKATSEDEAFLLSDYEYTYNGLIYRIQFDETGRQLLLDQYDIIHEPTQEDSKSDYSMYELKTFPSLSDFDNYQIIPTASNFKSEEKDLNGTVISYNRIVCRVGEHCEDRIVPLGQYVMKTASFGQSTFKPVKVAVDKSGNMFIASSGTSSGMIQMSYVGEFISFFVVNKVSYDFLYHIIKQFGTKEQLDKLIIDKPQPFSNVFVDHNNLVYSLTTESTLIFDKYSTSGSSVLEYTLTSDGTAQVTDSYVTKDGLIFIACKTGTIYVCEPTGRIIFYFGFTGNNTTSSIIGFFKNLTTITVDRNNNIWVADATSNYLQTFTPTNYTNSIYNAITSFNNHDYEQSRKSWEEVLKYDSLSVLANDGLGKAYYYDLDFESSLEYFTTSKNRSLYSNVFWELRNDFLQQNLLYVFLGLIGIIVVIYGVKILFKKNKKCKEFKEKTKKVSEKRWFKDLTVGFRLIKKPNDTFYELKTKKRGSILGATIYYILAIIAIILNTYCYALPFQIINANTLNPSIVLFLSIGIIGVFILCNYLVSAINDGEGTFADIYKFTGYSLLPIIIFLPIAVLVSYGLTLNEQVVITLLKGAAFWGSGIILVLGILEVHNYTFSQTVKNIVLTIVFMVLFIIICAIVVVMLDQIATFIEQIWREVKLRANWY
ncbi:MAG: YIP1 family protein [Erysipelotrichaceae bacterium]|nr:YIP1 family protein [Erysipelotrichaceae bacterium]